MSSTHCSESSHWPSFRWSELCSPDFSHPDHAALLQRTIAVLPVGATEQHGPHLPLNVDSTIANGIVTASIQRLAQMPAAQRPAVLFLPTQTVGYSPEHQSFPGTLTLEPATIIALWLELGACVARAGVRKLLIFNSHGGHVGVMDIVARQLRVRHQMLTYSTSWNHLPLAPEALAPFSAHEQRFGIHAGDQETSMMLHLAPGQVRMAQARDFPSTSEERARRFAILGNGRSAKMGWQMQDYNPDGAAGNAQAATADKGRLLVESAAEQLALLLQEMAALPLPPGVSSSSPSA